MDFSESHEKVLTRVAFSDHHPILIMSDMLQRYGTPRKFKFESVWLFTESYQELLKTTWKGDRSLEENLKTITIDIKAWKFNNIDQFIRKKKELMERLKCIQNSIQSRSDHGGLVKM